MKHFLFAAGALGLVAACAAAQNPATPPAQPAVQPKAVPAQPGGFGTARVTAARMAQLEEEVETLEAHRDVRKAHVKAAGVAVKAAELGVQQVRAAAEKGIVSKEEIDKAALGVEAAKAQLEIHVAEMREVEVKIKYAKKRLEDAKAAGVRQPGDNPFRKADPRPADPPPPR